MAYTTPRTWVTGEVVTAAFMNTDVRDNVGELKSTVELDTGGTLIHRHGYTALASRPAAGQGGRFWIASDGAKNAYFDDGSAWRQIAEADTLTTILDRSHSTVDVTNTTTETSIYSKSIDANALGVNGGVRLFIAGDMLMNTAGTMTLRVKLGSTTILASNTFSLTAESVRGKWTLEIWFLNQGVANSQIMGTLFILAEQDAASWEISSLGGGSAGGLGGSGLGTAAEDTTSARTLDVTAQWSATSASLSFRKEMAVLEQLGA